MVSSKESGRVLYHLRRDPARASFLTQPQTRSLVTVAASNPRNDIDGLTPLVQGGVRSTSQSPVTVLSEAMSSSLAETMPIGQEPRALHLSVRFWAQQASIDAFWKRPLIQDKRSAFTRKNNPRGRSDRTSHPPVRYGDAREAGTGPVPTSKYRFVV